MHFILLQIIATMVYKSSNGGDSWVLQSDFHLLEEKQMERASQSWYDLSLGVARNNENLVYVGGINLWRSDDGGVSWDIDGSSGNGSSYSYMHVDQHALEFNPHTNVALREMTGII